MDGGVGESQRGAEAVRDDQAHGHGENSGQSEIKAMLDQVDPSQHEHGVDEHE